MTALVRVWYRRLHMYMAVPGSLVLRLAGWVLYEHQPRALWGCGGWRGLELSVVREVGVVVVVV